MDEGRRHEAEKLVRAALALHDASGRGPATELRTALTQLTRPVTVVCVVGEYKQGKSALVNALVGADVCPVDDDLATSALTLVHAAERPRASVRLVSDGEEVVREITPDEVAEYTVEPDGGARHDVRHVEIGVPGSRVDDGLVLIDTPGVGGLDPAVQEAVLNFLPCANAALFVSDASAELSRAEVEFVRRARGACPDVVVVLTKIDLYGEWRRIAELDRRHLGTIGYDTDPVPVSALLHRSARSPDATAHDESGIDALRARLRDDVRGRAARRTAERALRAAAATVADDKVGVAESLKMLRDPEIARQRVAELERARSELADLKSAGARWGTVLQDGFSTLRAETDFRLRSMVRNLMREADAELGADGDATEGWETWVDDLRLRVTTEIQSIVSDAQQERDRVAAAIAELIGSAGLAGDGPSGGDDIEPALAAEIATPGTDDVSLLGSGLTALRGVQSGVLLLGMMAQLVGAAVLTPVALGVGVALGGRQLREERSKRRQRRQQEARTEIRRFLEHVQFEVGNHLQRNIADEQRALRDRVTEAIGQRDRALRERTAEAEGAVREVAADRDQRIAELEDRLTRIEALAAAISRLQADLDRRPESDDDLG